MNPKGLFTKYVTAAKTNTTGYAMESSRHSHKKRIKQQIQQPLLEEEQKNGHVFCEQPLRVQWFPYFIPPASDSICW